MSSSDSDTDANWDEWEDEDDDLPAQSLFDARIFPSVRAALAHDLSTYEFDLERVCRDLGLDFYGAVRLVNVLRSRVAKLKDGGEAPTVAWANAFVESLRSGDASLNGDEDLHPFLENDAILMAVGTFVSKDSDLAESGASGVEEKDEQDVDEMEAVEGVTAEADGPSAAEGSEIAHASRNGAPATIESLLAENEALKAELAAARKSLENSKRLLAELSKDEDDEVSAGGRDDSYFASYSHFDIHETMLRDTVRTGAYERAILGNRAVFKGKTVLDVGCGTGVLSMFAARAGAAKVIGVEMSDAAKLAQRLVDANGLSSVITVVQGKMEDVSLPVERVDVIISEWMGYALLYEAMLPSVLAARDRYLTPGGLVLPDATPLFLEGVCEEVGRVGWLKDVHGLDYSCLQDELLREASVEVVTPERIVTDRVQVQTFDALKASAADLDFEAPFRLTASSDTELTGFVLSFDVGFVSGLSEPVWFSTAAAAAPTHWKQTVLWLSPAERLKLKLGEAVTGVLKVRRRSANKRELDLAVTWAVAATEAGSGCDAAASGSRSYVMA